jgi:AcrR family transcriptional regulator
MKRSRRARAADNLLSAREIRACNKPGKYADGGKLYLQVKEQADGRITKSWVFRYVSVAGQRREMGLGSLADVGLIAARAKRAECQALLDSGLDPIEQRRLDKSPSRAHPKAKVSAAGKPGLQASKSRRKRLDILDATLECLARKPYPEVTIAAVAEHAGISKGGIQYHFPSRYQLLRGAIDRLFERRLDAYKKDLANVPDGVPTTDHVIDHHWKHLTEPEFQIYQELVVASRSDRRLRMLLIDRYRTFRQQWSELSLVAYGWDYRDEQVVVLGNIAQYLMDGMAYGWLVDQLSDADVDHLLAFTKAIMREGLSLSRSGRRGPLTDFLPA